MSTAKLADEDAAWVARIRAGNDTNSATGDIDAANTVEPDDEEARGEASGLDGASWPEPFGGDATGDRPMVDLDDDRECSGNPADPDDKPAARRRFNPWVAAGFGAVAVVATVVTFAAGAITSHDDPAPPAPPSVVARPPQPPAPASTSPAVTDEPLRFTATSDCDRLPGSTPAQLLADPQAKAPWICASSAAGEVLHIYLDRPEIITAVSIVPGAVNKTSTTDQGDPWPLHRVVTRLQWQFNDTANTIKPQKTGNVHGEAVQAVPSVLASEITIIIQETSRPPLVAAPTSTTSAPSGDGILGPILGGPSGGDASTAPVLPGQPDRPDPSDGTFAITSIKVIGHQVK
ncbi:hypothetical protein MFM001_42440 [Mycobacterium sp. MFM001]|uniref:hypothetical protein n=1 Tax=Mycobacterium sp. MFM001 TaxID=2049453 RepID=UPI000DA46AC1|nr:hypothetical protein [Mycobacterium sp. MFM001]GBE67782.1 hypothetical protein MFM001_42440 [Mycobacterium sp. MFM001]